MANLTIVIDDDLLKRARLRALEQGTSVNAVLREYLEAFAGRDTTRTAIATLLDLSDRASSGSGPGGRTWTREDLYER
ncbi:MAG TPA: hypothetical protein VIM17_10500 [Jatrophihabitantaceae bacterium]